jgi:hypothetical protein
MVNGRWIDVAFLPYRFGGKIYYNKNPKMFIPVYNCLSTLSN